MAAGRGLGQGWIDAQGSQIAGVWKLDAHDKGGVGNGQQLLDGFFSRRLFGFLLLNEEESRAIVKQANGIGLDSAADNARGILFGAPSEEAVHSLSGNRSLAVHKHRAGPVPLLVPAKYLVQ